MKFVASFFFFRRVVAAILEKLNRILENGDAY